jgi:hypothetical protein
MTRHGGAFFWGGEAVLAIRMIIWREDDLISDFERARLSAVHWPSLFRPDSGPPYFRVGSNSPGRTNISGRGFSNLRMSLVEAGLLVTSEN